MKHLLKLKPDFICFDGTHATATDFQTWMKKVCPQNLDEPVLVPVSAVKAALAISEDLIVTPNTINGIPYTPGDDVSQAAYAEIPAPHEMDVPPFNLDLKKLENAAKVAAVGDTRYYLNGVFFDFNHTTLVGCDGHRLHMYNGATIPSATLDHHAIMPIATVKLALLVKALQFGYWKGFFAVWFPGGTIVSKAIDGIFPDYKRVTPTESNVFAKWLVKPVLETAKKLEKIHKANASKYSPVQIDHFRTIAINDVVSFPLNPIVLQGKKFLGAVNVKYLIDTLSCLDDTATIGLKDGLNTDAFLIEDGDFKSVIMQVRL